MGNLSRHYRPQKFSEITGQNAIIQTLLREVGQNKLGHAYLFSGPRGVGKTTAARIFAKAINCLDQKNGEPCLKCASCSQIAGSSAIDIMEIDAASHTGVANIREAIVEHVQFVPASLKYKVYILDEAHMLSDSSWNALLKTIEEPPDYAIFIFATTERHKVPATIISRCQRFEFTKITQKDVVERLKTISESENVKIEDSVLSAIADRTEGCLRDAENILGQLISLGEPEINDQIASIILPPSSLPIAAELLEITFSRNHQNLMEKIQQLEDQGADFIQLLDDLIIALRRMLLAKSSSKQLKSIADTDQTGKILAELSQKTEGRVIIDSSLILMERRREAKSGIDPRFALELGLSAIAYNIQSPSDSTAEARRPTSDVKTSDKIPKEPPKTKPEEQDAKYKIQDTKNQAENNLSPSPSISLIDVQKIWPQFLQAFEDQKSLLLLLKPSRVIDVQNDCLQIEFQYAYHLKSVIENQKNRNLIEDALRRLLNNSSITIKGSVRNNGSQQPENKPNDVANNLIDAFGGQIIG
ncbi:MAG: DNA polymerase III subunit gamma/tau [Patescibacteria group bacterium]